MSNNGTHLYTKQLIAYNLRKTYSLIMAKKENAITKFSKFFMMIKVHKHGLYKKVTHATAKQSLRIGENVHTKSNWTKWCDIGGDSWSGYDKYFKSCIKHTNILCASVYKS